MNFGFIIFAITILAAIVVVGFFARRLLAQDNPKKKALGWILVIFVAIFAIALPGMIIYRVHGLFDLYQKFASSLIDEVGVDPRLAHGILLLALLPYGVMLKWFFSIKSQRRKIARAGIIVYIAGFNLVMYFLTKEIRFPHTIKETGSSESDTLTAQKWYAVTPEGCVFYSTPGYDTKYGIKLKPLTPAANIECQSLEHLDGIDFNDSDAFFDIATGEPIKWYSIDQDGIIQIFPHAGFDKRTREKLNPVDPTVVRRYIEQENNLLAAKKREKEASAHKQKVKQQEAAIEMKRQDLLTNVSGFKNSRNLAIIFTKSSHDSFGSVLYDLQTELENVLESQNYRIVASPFTSRFIEQEYPERLLENDTQILKELGLSNIVGTMLIVKLAYSGANAPSMGTMQITELSARFCQMHFDGSKALDIRITGQGTGSDERMRLSQAMFDLKGKLSQLKMSK